MAKFKYRIWCETESVYTYVWSDSVPSECPNGAGHSVDPDKMSIVQTKHEYLIDPINGPFLKILSPDGNTEKELTIDNNGSFIVGEKYVKIGGTNSVITCFTDGSKSYVKTNSSSYQTMAYILFGGTNDTGQPISIKVLGNSKAINKDFQVRLVCSVTGNIIAESAAVSGKSIFVIDLGTISNLPANASAVEIQGKTVVGGECRLSSLNIQF